MTGENNNIYLLFGGKKYYPNGGIGDYIVKLDSIEDAYLYIDKAPEYLWPDKFD